jgi:glycosyltransferase involved in cell wall biosynthesis
MRFAVVDTTLTTSPTGGCQTFLDHLAPALETRGHQVHVVTQPGNDHGVADRLTSSGVRVLYDVCPPRLLPEDRALCLAEWCTQEHIEAYIVSVSADIGWLALPHLRPAVRTAAVVHSDSPTFYGPLAHYGPFVDRAIGVSRETQRNIRRLCALPEERTRHIPYGVRHLAETQLAERPSTSATGRRLEVAYVGRLVHSQKRVLDLVPILTELARRGVPLLMHLVGAGEDGPRLREELDRAGLSDRVRWWGWLKPDEVSERLKQLDALVLPSDVEGLPLATLEAMAHGVVPVATRIPSGSSELISDAENGFLVAVGDSKGFADRLEELYLNPALLARLSRSAWASSQDYSVERMALRYEECLSGGGSRAPRPASYPVMPSCRSRYPRWLRRAKWHLADLAARSREASGTAATRASAYLRPSRERTRRG